MPVPKRKHSKARRDRRRMQDKVAVSTTVKCKYCGASKISHRACPECNRY